MGDRAIDPVLLLKETVVTWSKLQHKLGIQSVIRNSPIILREARTPAGYGVWTYSMNIFHHQTVLFRVCYRFSILQGV